VELVTLWVLLILHCPILGLKGSLPRNGSDGIQRVPSIFVPQNRIPVIFSSAEDSEPYSESSFYFCSTERNSELFSLPRKGSEEYSIAQKVAA